MAANFASHLTHIAQIARAVGLGRGANADKGAVGIRNAIFKTGSKLEAAISAAVANHGFKTGFKNMHGTGIELFHHSRVNIHAGHGITHFSKARGADQANIAGPDNAQLHTKFLRTFPQPARLTLQRGTGQNSLG